MITLPPHLEIHDDRFAALIHPMSQLEVIAEGFTWTEGPVWFGDHDCLLFSDIPSQRIMRWSEQDGVSVFRSGSGFNNGNTRDRQGRLVGCRHGMRDVVRTEIDGSLTVLADRFDGKRLNSPNDVVVSSDGAVWFTDPTYGIISNFEGYRSDPEQSGRNVFRMSPGGELSAVVTDFSQPNGLCFSPDEKTLYIAESGSSHDDKVPSVIRRFAVEGGDLRAGERTYQQVAQVAGRAGRGSKPGEVLIQTRHPEAPVIAALAAGDRDAFYSAETEMRREAGAPPFGRWASIIISSEDDGEAREAANRLGAFRPDVADCMILGPAPAPMALLRGRYRYRFLINARRSVQLQHVIRRWLTQVDHPAGVRVAVDIDPYSFV